MNDSDPVRGAPQSFHFWSIDEPISRATYRDYGVSLMLVKYAVECGAIWWASGKFYTPLDFINPLASARLKFAQGGPDWLTPLWLLWTIPFVAIAVTFTIRRAINAGWSPWWGLAILIPFVNLAVMVAFAMLPEAPADVELTEARRAPTLLRPGEPPPSAGLAVLSGVIVSTCYATLMTVACIYLFDTYGAAVFFGTPLVAGAFTAFTYNFREGQSVARTLIVAMLPVLCLGGVLLLLALEGAVCILMAAPIMLPLAVVGGLIGKVIADISRDDERRKRELYGCLVVLPVLAFGESRLAPRPELCVSSSIDVAAAPEDVWRHVVDFPPIESAEPWLFRVGIAGPQGARIDGEGVGAVRHCDFTTGSFVEPITTWDEPRRLAFDVSEQPDPMTELSPYRKIQPPHLDGSFRSTRGEFELTPLPDGGTRLVGRTWYTLDIAPHAFWKLWTDWIVHRIHGRVLEHIKELAEDEGRRSK